MDGMLTDSEPLWRIASVEVLNGIGVPLTEEDAVATTGLRTDELVESLPKRTGVALKRLRDQRIGKAPLA